MIRLIAVFGGRIDSWNFSSPLGYSSQVFLKDGINYLSQFCLTLQTYSSNFGGGI